MSESTEASTSQTEFNSLDDVLASLRCSKSQGANLLGEFANYVKQQSAECAILPSDLAQKHLLFNLNIAKR
jgi:hypothetical protein